MYELKRPKLIEQIRKSIENYRITNIFGIPGIGKTTVCMQCLETYFSNINTTIIRPGSTDQSFITFNFTKGMYVFENFDYSQDRKFLIPKICSISSEVTDIKFIFLSYYNLALEYNSPFLNSIEVPQLTQNETLALFNNLYNKDLLDKYLVEQLLKISDGLPLSVRYITKILLESNIQDSCSIIYNPCIVDCLGKPLDVADNAIKIVTSEINDELLYDLAKNPNLLYALSSYDFERVIARMFEKKGFSVKITQKTRDGGKDIFVAKNDLCSFLFYVECKKYAPDRPVGIDVVQRLYGVVSAEKATGGIVATTSHFAKPVKDYIREYKLENQITLQDYETITNILKTF